MPGEGLDQDLNIKQEVDFFEECGDFGTSDHGEDHFHIKQEPDESIQHEDKENYDEEVTRKMWYAKIQTSRFPIVLLRKIDEQCQDAGVGKNFLTKIKLENLHIKQEPKDPMSYQCPECSYTTKRKTNLVTHLLVHYGTKRFVCSECDFKSNYKRSLKNHLMSHFKIPVPKLFKCLKCDYTTNLNYNMKRHTLTHLKENLTNLPSNPVRNFGEEKVDRSEELLEAALGMNFKSIPRNNHQEKSTILKSSKKLFCSKCNYSTIRKSNLKLHIRQHSGLNIYKCTECDYESNWHSCFKRHVFSHSGVLLFKCHICNYGSNRKSYLEKHLLTHFDKRLHKCTKCDYATNWESNLKSHLVRHSNSEKLGKKMTMYKRNLRVVAKKKNCN